MATKSKNISLKSKFQDNTSNLYTKQDLKNDKLSKIKVSLQKSKIKNKKAIISLNKRVYKNKQTTDFINTSFSELIKSNPNYTIPKFFEVYENLFYDIPKEGEKSHTGPRTSFGLLGQEVKGALDKLGLGYNDFGAYSDKVVEHGPSGWTPSYQEEDKTIGLSYVGFVAPLIKAVQELSAEVTELKAQLKTA